MQRFLSRRPRRSDTEQEGSVVRGMRVMRLLRAVAIVAALTIAYIWLHAGYRIEAELDRELNASLRERAVLVREIEERNRLLRQLCADYSGSGDKTQVPSRLPPVPDVDRHADAAGAGERLARRKLGAYMTFAVIPTLLISVLMLFMYQALRRQYMVVRKYDGMRRRAVEASRRKSRFLATVVHELRTPLTGIQGYSELVRDESSDALSREFSDLIYQSAIHLHGLLNTLFDLARIEAGKVAIFREPIQAAPFFNYIGALHQLAAQKKQLRFRLVLAPDLPAQFSSDRLRLSQVLNNLLDNAIKFTAHGGIALEIAALKGEIRFKVTDTGPGMEKKDLKHLFEYFYQSETVRAQRGHGLGLGLSLAKEFTELMGGSIRIESEPGVGTMVELIIPMDSR